MSYAWIAKTAGQRLILCCFCWFALWLSTTSADVVDTKVHYTEQNFRSKCLACLEMDDLGAIACLSSLLDQAPTDRYRHKVHRQLGFLWGSCRSADSTDAYLWHFNEAARYAKVLEDHDAVAEAYLEASYELGFRGEYLKCLHYLRQFESLRVDISSHMKNYAAWIYGEFYGLIDEAELMYVRNREICKEAKRLLGSRGSVDTLPNAYIYFECFSNVADYHAAKGCPDSAQHFLDQLRGHLQGNVDVTNELWVQLFHSEVYAKMQAGNYLGAAEQLENVSTLLPYVEPTDIWFANVHELLAECYLKLGKYERALQSAEQSIAMFSDSYSEYFWDSDEWKRESYHHAALAARELGAVEKYDVYSAKYLSLDSLDYEDKKLFLKGLLEIHSIKPLRDQLDHASSRLMQVRKYNLVTAILILVILGVFVVYYARASRYKTELQALTRESPVQRERRTLENVSDEGNFQIGNREQEILDRLKEFESSKVYLDPNLSLPAMATRLKTNRLYLNRLIHKYRNSQTYTDYINNLRISHILNEVRTDESYQRYKLSYIARCAGFSSPETFRRVFKKQVGMAPITYISQYHKGDEGSPPG